MCKPSDFPQQERQDSFSVSEVMEGVWQVLGALDTLPHIPQALNLYTRVHIPSIDLYWGRRWQPDDTVMEVEWNYSEPLLPLLPPFGSEGFQDLEDGVKAQQ